MPSDTDRPVVSGSAGGAPARAETATFVEPQTPELTKKPSSGGGFVETKSKAVERGTSWTDYENPDGTHTRLLSTDVINYKDAAGAWAAVDNTLVTDASGVVVNRANSWRVRFTGTGEQGLQVVPAAGQSALRVLPAGAAAVKPVVSGSEVTYTDLWPSVDAKYVVTGSMVKEILVIKDRQAATEFGFAVSSADAKAEVSKAAADATVAVQPDGSVRASKGDSAVAFEPPVVVTADGAPVKAAAAKFAAGGAGKVALSLDKKWLASQPDSAFPIMLDPTIRPETGPWYVHAFRSDGGDLLNQGTRIGNSRDGGDKYWRSVVRYDWTNMAYSKILDSYFHLTKVAGASTATPVNVYWSSAESYAGAVSGSVLATGSIANPYFGGDTWINSLQSWASQGGFPWPSFAGGETAGVYTYQQLIMDLYVNYDRYPTAPSVVWPANGSSQHRLNLPVQVSSSDPDGDALQYRFQASLTPDFSSDVVWATGWGAATQTLTLGEWVMKKKTVYWRAWSSDGYVETAGPTWSFTVTDIDSVITDSFPSGSGAAATVVSTTTPAFSIAASDGNGGTLRYNFTISGGNDVINGKASSGWVDATTWRVPEGVLIEGQQYAWTLSAREIDGSVWYPAASRTGTLKVDRRMGSGGPAPTDALGGASVNLASGNLFLSAEGHGVSSVGGELSVGLSYNSQLAAEHGLIGSYYQESDRNWVFGDEAPSLVRVDSLFDLAWNTSGTAAAPPGLAADQFMVRWQGYLTAPATGTYTLGVKSDDGVKVKLGPAGETLWYNDWTAHPLQADIQWASGQSFTQGQPVKITVEFYNHTGPAILQLYIKDPSGATSLLPSSWLSPGVSTLPTGWNVSLPGGGNSYASATPGYQSVVLSDASGQGHTYLEKTTGGYTPPAGESGTLTGSTTQGWTLTDSDGSVYVFNSAGLPISARSAVDAVHPAAATYTYDTTVFPARVSKITDPVSTREIQLSYGPSADCPATTTPWAWDAAPTNQLCKITYWDGTATILHYLNGQIAAVEEPGQAFTRFGYSEGLLTTIQGVLSNDLVLAGKIADSTAARTEIGYAWLAATAVNGPQTNIRPAFQTVTKDGNGNYPQGSIPVVTSVTGPAEDGVTATGRPQHSYTYTGTNTTAVTVAGIAGTASTVTYDTTGRLLTAQVAPNPVSTTAWDADGKDLTKSVTDPAGRKTTTIYDWADRATDTYGPAPASCFDTDGFPVASPPQSCGTIPHSHTGYDTDTSGARVTGLSIDQYTNLDLTGQPATRATAGLDPATWTNKDTGVSTRLTGEIALSAGDHTFSVDLANKTDDGVRVYVNDKTVIDRWWTLRQAVKADQPTYYWPMNTVTSDTGVGSQTATWTNQNVTFNGPAIGPVDTTATSSYTGNAAVSNNGLLNGIASPSVELWFKTADGANGVLVGQDNNTTSVYTPIMYITDDGLLHAGYYTANGAKNMTSITPVNEGNWHHAVLSVTPAVGTTTAATETLFVDGELVATLTQPIDLQTTATRVTVGTGVATGWPGNTTHTGFWPLSSGSIGRVAIYDHPLTLTSITRHYQAEKATLATTTATTFTAAPRTATGSLPAAPVATPQRLRVEYRNISGTATSSSYTLKQTPAGGSATAVPATALGTRYSLPTWQVTDDTGGVTGGKTTAATRYSNSTLDLQYGLATATIVDPGGLNLETKQGYEDPSASGSYLRSTAKALPSGDLTDATKATTTSYYGPTETRANPCVAGSPAVNQGGLTKTVTQPTAADNTQITEETVYDAAGDVIAVRNTADSGWTCTTYDNRGRVTQVTTPAFGTDTTPRTVTTTYTVNGDPRINTVSDPAGTITNTMDLYGRSTAYTDTSGVTTSTSYDQAGRIIGSTTVGASGGGGQSTVAYTYRTDGQIATMSLDGTVLATNAYDSAGELTGITYPFGTFGALAKTPGGALVGDTWTAGTRTFTETLTRSQAGRITASQWTDSTTPTSPTRWNYTYDPAGRLTQAILAAAGTRPQVTFGYSFDTTGGCGADPNAGVNGSRTGSSVQIGTGTPATSSYCTDQASRLTSVNDANAIPAANITYDTHGNATRIGDQTFTYDAADRVTGTTATSTGQTLAYTRDSTGRVRTRTATGPDNGATRYGFTSDDDNPDFQITPSGGLTERYLSLPGGVLIAKNYTNSSWQASLPNLHGDISIQLTLASNGQATTTATGWINDPYGQPLNSTTGAFDLTATPTTRTGTSTTDSWLGQHQRGYEHTSGLNQILMGARTYLPALGVFTATDPVEGGNDTPYAYPDDPVNGVDLDGAFSWNWNAVGEALSAVATVASFVPGPGNFISAGLSVASAGCFIAAGRPDRAAQEGVSAVVSLAFGAAGRLLAKAAVKTMSVGMRQIGYARGAIAGSRLLKPSSYLKGGIKLTKRNPIRDLQRIGRKAGGLHVVAGTGVLYASALVATSAFRSYGGRRWGWPKR